VKKAKAAKPKVRKPTRAERNVAWIERYIRVPEGRFVGKPLKVAPYMVKDLQAIYDNPAGTRRAIISRGRKNAKTVEAALIVLLHLCGPEAKPNAQLNSAAQSREQAAILFSLAAKMIRMSPDLSAVVVIRDTAKQLECPQLGTLYKALSADASTSYGLSPAVSIHDELGQVKGPRSELYEALETATAAQDEPLSVIISTQAPTDGDLLSILIDDAKRGEDPRTVLRLDTAPEDMDPFTEEAIRAANPAFDLFMNKTEVLAMAEDARRVPSQQPAFENLVLNRRVDMNAPFVSRVLWNGCKRAPIEDFDGLDVYAGLDLSSTQDLTAFVRIARHEGVWHVKPTFWLPEQGLRDKAVRDRVPYDTWKAQHYLETTPGKSIEYEYVAALIFEEHRENPFRKIAFDRWNMKHLRPWLLKAGFLDEEIEGDTAIFEEFGQGFQSMSPALRTLESLILNEQLAHGGHPVLTWCAANATVQTEPAGGRKLSKSKSHGRIDGMVALAMAAGVSGADMPTASSVSFWEQA
jgi:phage terminase large subunit-like protein